MQMKNFEKKPGPNGHNKWVIGCVLFGVGIGVLAGLFVHEVLSVNFGGSGYYPIIAGIVASAPFFVLAWLLEKDEAKEKQDLEAQVPASLIEQPEMGTCIYCGKEIDEETAICDDCLKG